MFPVLLLIHSILRWVILIVTGSFNRAKFHWMDQKKGTAGRRHQALAVYNDFCAYDTINRTDSFIIWQVWDPE